MPHWYDDTHRKMMSGLSARLPVHDDESALGLPFTGHHAIDGGFPRVLITSSPGSIPSRGNGIPALFARPLARRVRLHRSSWHAPVSSGSPEGSFCTPNPLPTISNPLARSAFGTARQDRRARDVFNKRVCRIVNLRADMRMQSGEMRCASQRAGQRSRGRDRESEFRIWYCRRRCERIRACALRCRCSCERSRAAARKWRAHQGVRSLRRYRQRSYPATSGNNRIEFFIGFPGAM